MIEAEVDYHGAQAASIGNQFLRLDYLTQAGPRIVRLVMAGSEVNLLGESPLAGWDTPYGYFHLWGGHRLWYAPESVPRSSIPDDEGLQAIPLPSGVQLLGPLETPTGLRKEIEVTLLEGRPALQLVHRIHNESLWPVELAPWAVTILPAGGIAVIAHQRSGKGGHQPDRHLAIWPDTRWDDPRFHYYDSALVIEGTPNLPPCKIGLYTWQGWLAYACNEAIFVKRFKPVRDKPYPDHGCNAEIYCGPAYVELESLAPLHLLQPGQSAAHTEIWEIYPALKDTHSLRETAEAISQIVN
ncbi:MAG: hypothetical protein JW726_02995 [Anaerolineales bacterium]|nr:hypothetical protein [Anaerolineales bacterium]